MSDDEAETVEVPVSLIRDIADHHKEVAKYGYKRNKTGMADMHHAWARQLHDADTREWSEVGE